MHRRLINLTSLLMDYPVDLDNSANGSHDAASPWSIKSIEPFPYLRPWPVMSGVLSCDIHGTPDATTIA